MAQVLIIDDEPNLRKILSAMLKAEGHTAVVAKNLSEAKEKLLQGGVEVVLTDLCLEQENGLHILPWVREQQMAVPVVILTAHGTVDSAVDAMKKGAFDYLTKPFERSEIARVIEKAYVTYRFNQKTAYGPHTSFSFLGESGGLQKLLSSIDKIAASDATVLISGETGTGKESVAERLHERSPRSEGPFIKIHCAAIPPSLMSSELFGHEKGAFTGASSAKPGRIELADKGTLFLDEIGDLSLEMQVQLLRVLQEKKIQRVGGLRSIEIDFRLIAATHRNLESEVQSGRFREDLYFRLNVVPIRVPALRERASDIPGLVAAAARKFSGRLGKEVPEMSAEVLELLTQYPWPGNIRQLENTVERLLILSDGRPVLPDLLPEEILDYEDERYFQGQGVGLKERVKDAVRGIEKKVIEEALELTHQNVTQAARRLNISRKGLQLKMKELGLR